VAGARRSRAYARDGRDRLHLRRELDPLVGPQAPTPHFPPRGAQRDNLTLRIESARHTKYDWALWLKILEFYVALPEEKLEWEALDAAAHLAIGAMWLDDLDPRDWDEDGDEH
jgi:hypothetical protein